MHEYTTSGGWKRISIWSLPSINPFYVHADQHNIYYHPTKLNEFYVVSDGGLSKTSDNGSTFVTMNREFNTMQFYGIGIGADRTLIGGAQDNGTNINDGTGNTPNSALEVRGGDGGRAAISWLDPDVYFGYSTVTIIRTGNAASSWEGSADWFNAEMQNSNIYWNIPFELHETTSDVNSADSVDFIAYPAFR